MRERAAQLGYDISQPYVAAHVQLGDDGRRHLLTKPRA